MGEVKRGERRGMLRGSSQAHESRVPRPEAGQAIPRLIQLPGASSSGAGRELGKANLDSQELGPAMAAPDSFPGSSTPGAPRPICTRRREPCAAGAQSRWRTDIDLSPAAWRWSIEGGSACNSGTLRPHAARDGALRTEPMLGASAAKPSRGASVPRNVLHPRLRVRPAAGSKGALARSWSLQAGNPDAQEPGLPFAANALPPSACGWA